MRSDDCYFVSWFCMLGYWYTINTSIKHIGLRLIPFTLNYLASQAILFDWNFKKWKLHTKIRLSPKTLTKLDSVTLCVEIHVKYGVVNYTLIMVLQVLETDQGLFMTMFLNIQRLEISSDFMHTPESSTELPFRVGLICAALMHGYLISLCSAYEPP